jgi:N-acetylmuramoyl-L-alanine amidase
MPQRSVSLKIRQRHLSYAQRLDSRRSEDINLFVVHCTELPDLAMARVYGEKVHYPEAQTGNSGHFYIDRDGSIEQWVPLDRVAHHVKGFNPRSIGVELVNTGRYPDWFCSDNQKMSEPYPVLQIKALVALVEHLQTRLSGLEKIAGHEDLDTGMIASEDQSDTMIRRKLDPGPLFPWSELMDNVSLHRIYAESP